MVQKIGITPLFYHYQPRSRIENQLHQKKKKVKNGNNKLKYTILTNHIGKSSLVLIQYQAVKAKIK